MSKTVVSLFPSTGEAQKVKQELMAEGYPAASIQIVANEQAAAAGVSGGSSQGGFGSAISHFFRSLTGGNEAEQEHYTSGVQQGGAVLSVKVEDGQENQLAALLESYGGEDVDGRNGPSSSPLDDGTVSVIQEEMVVGKRQVQRGGVRVYSHLVETPVEETVRLREEHVHVDRQAVSRPATEADFAAFKEGSIELTETAEEAVVAKNARVVEEVVVDKKSSETTQTVRGTVRHTEVEVEKLDSSSDPDFRSHFSANYGSTGRKYEEYAPAYEYGHRLAGDPRYSSNSWSSIEANAQKDWAAKGAGKWEDFKGAVQQGWNKVRETASAKK